MDRHELIRRLVLRSEVVSALASLVEDGLAKAYDLCSLTNGDPFSRGTSEHAITRSGRGDFRTYFYVARKGMALHRSGDTWWPLEF